METLSSTPIIILRQNNKSFKSRQRQLDRRVRNKKHLRQQIYSNHNIFQSSINLYRNKTAQNIIWDKNYNFKCMINDAKEQNSSLKAHIWNMEKENRRMERQLEAWNLNDLPQHHRQPYIDMATVEAVMQDQDYQIVSLKMSITKLERTLLDRQKQLNQLHERNGDITNITRLLNRQITNKQVEIYECLPEDAHPQQHHYSKEQLGREMLRQNSRLEQLHRNIEQKKRTKASLQSELGVIEAELEQHKTMNQAEVDRLRDQTRKMRAEEDGGRSLAQEKLRMVKESTLELQCQMQEVMNKYIQQKLPLKRQIAELLDMLKQCQTEIKNISQCKTLHNLKQ